MPDSKEHAEAVEQEAQNAKGTHLPSFPLPRQSMSSLNTRSDPNHPAHPDHPKVRCRYCISFIRIMLILLQHGEHVKNFAKKFGNAAVFGAGATAGADAIKGALGQ